MKTAYIAYSSFSKLCPIPRLPLPSRLQPLPKRFLMLSYFFSWIGHCAIFDVVLLNDIMDLHMLSLGTLVSELCCVLSNKASNLLRSDTYYAFFLISHTHKNKHTQIPSTQSGANRLTHSYKYILTPPVMYLQQLSFTEHKKSISNVFFFFKNYTKNSEKYNTGKG